MDSARHDLRQARWRVLVIAGGCSPERAVSLESGQCVTAALRRCGHTVSCLDPAEQPVRGIDVSRWDIVFPMLHGAGGEDGVLQRELESIGLPWVGCSAESSALTFDKIETRKQLRQHGISVPPGTALHDSAVPPTPEFPLVVKPARQGSSIGVSIVRSTRDWDAAVRLALSLGPDLLVESWIAGREVSVAVVDDQVFPAVEIIFPGGWYDYAAKYTSDATQYVVGSENLPAELGAVALQACRVCNAHGILRVDFRVDSNGQPFVLEINSIPGMTTHSLVPKAAAALGLSLSELCDKCLQRRMLCWSDSVETAS